MGDVVVGARGCAAQSDRRKPGSQPGAMCAQQWITLSDDGRRWCYYHDPARPRKFGHGYSRDPRRSEK